MYSQIVMKYLLFPKILLSKDQKEKVLRSLIHQLANNDWKTVWGDLKIKFINFFFPELDMVSLH